MTFEQSILIDAECACVIRAVAGLHPPARMGPISPVC